MQLCLYKLLTFINLKGFLLGNVQKKIVDEKDRLNRFTYYMTFQRIGQASGFVKCVESFVQKEVR